MPLTRRKLISLAVTSAPAFLVPPAIFARNDAAALYSSSIVIDGLGFPGGLESQDQSGLSKAELADVHESGITALHLTVGPVGTMNPLQAFEGVVRDIARWDSEIEAHPAELTRVRTVQDIEAARAAHKTGLIYGLQDGVCFEDDPERLQALHQLGVRVIQPTYNRRNLLGDGCMEPADAGLSRAGFAVIEKLNELGILVDLSHCGRRTAADAIAASSRPVSFTHSGSFVLAEHPRHRTDEEIRAVAETGGVVGVFIMPYLAQGAQPSAADVIAHLEHLLNVAGEDHVSIGTDGTVSPTELTPEFIESFREETRRRQELGIAAPFETETGYLFAQDLNSPRRLETLAGLLLQRGHSQATVRKILGANLLRVFSETWS